MTREWTRNMTIIKIAKKLLWMQKYQPIRFYLISLLADSMVLGFWMLSSVGIAFWLADHGLCALDSALMGVALIDLNVAFFSILTDPRFE